MSHSPSPSPQIPINTTNIPSTTICGQTVCRSTTEPESPESKFGSTQNIVIVSPVAATDIKSPSNRSKSPVFRQTSPSVNIINPIPATVSSCVVVPDIVRTSNM